MANLYRVEWQLKGEGVPHVENVEASKPHVAVHKVLASAGTIKSHYYGGEVHKVPVRTIGPLSLRKGDSVSVRITRLGR